MDEWMDYAVELKDYDSLMNELKMYKNLKNFWFGVSVIALLSHIIW